MSKTIRFWHYGNGEVLITLRKDQTLRHSSGGPTDEGWRRESHEWSFDGHIVTHEWSEDGVDCDGRLSREGISWFAGHESRSGYVVDGIAYPNWHLGRSWQRDYSAEAMGY
jgi:hypothetical protein